MNLLSEMSNRPGVAMYSKEWKEIVMPGVDNALGDAAIQICRMYNLGSSIDPMIVYDTIVRAIIGKSTSTVSILVTPDGEVLDGNSG